MNMFLKAFLEILWFVCFPSVCVSYTNFSSDYRISMTQLNPIFQNYADQLLAISEDMPRPCRKDICYADMTYHFQKGRMQWPEITTSHKVELRCPYSFKVPMYTTRVCGLDMQGVATWETPDHIDVCPDPPLAELIKEIHKEVGAANYKSNINGFNSTSYKIMYAGILQRIVDVFTSYRDTPIFGTDVHDVLYFYDHAVDHLILNNQKPVSLDITNNLLSILNTLMDEDLKEDFSNAMYNRWEILSSIVETLPFKIKKKKEESLTFILPNIVMYLININHDTPDRLNITNVFTVPALSNDTTTTPNITLDLSKVYRASDTTFDLGVTLLRETNILVKYYTWNKVEEYVEELLVFSPSEDHLAIPTEVQPQANRSKNIQDVQQMTTSTVQKNMVHTLPQETVQDKNHQWNHSNESFINNSTYSHQDTSTISPVLTATAYNPTPLILKTNNVLSKVTMRPIILTATNIEQVEFFIGTGNTVFLTSSMYVRDIGIHYDMFESCVGYDDCSTKQVCVKGYTSTQFKQWDNEECSSTSTRQNNGYTSCQCNGLGSYALFYEMPGPSIVNLPTVTAPTKIPIITVEAGDISAFLGFPYRRGLEMLGNILGFISLVCLLLTVLSYAFFRRTRKGAPTTILLNLCVALICLSSLLITIYFAADVITMTGCTVTNTLRYYFVFVTLLWNGIEGFNMYMMLIRVLNSKITNFGVKSGIIAWGLPIIMLGACYGANKKSFHGQHVLISAEEGLCIYKCSLKSDVLLYGYIFPMAVIIIHNFIIFSFVLRAIVKHGNMLDKAQKHSKLVQLVGAIATLVLLGVPWMFSAFGAIDATKSINWKWTEIIFQVIFVVFVNLQGVFIFIFHCMRNSQMRQSWSSAVRGSTITSRISMVFKSSSNNNGTTHSGDVNSLRGVKSPQNCKLSKDLLHKNCGKNVSVDILLEGRQLKTNSKFNSL